MATVELEAKQTDVAVNDNKSTGDAQTATPVTPKLSILPDVSLLTPPKSGPLKTQQNQNNQQRRRSEVTSPYFQNPFSPFSSPSSPLASPSTPRSLEHIQAENQYLFNELHRLDVRIRSLLGTLGAVQAQLQRQETATQAGQDPLPFTTAEARKLRKSAGFIQSKIASSERQEKLIVVRIGEVMAEMQGRQWLAQLQQQRQQRRVSVTSNANGNGGLSSPIALTADPGYFPLQVPQTPYLAPCDVWIPDQLHFTQQFTHPFSPPFGHDQQGLHHEQHQTAMTSLVLPQSFVVSPVTPGLHATMPASPVSPPASVVGGEGHSRKNSCMSPMSPLAPVFEPGSPFGSTSFFPSDNDHHGDSAATPIARRPSSSAAQAAALDHVGMHYTYGDVDAVVDDDDGEGAGQNYTHECYSNENGNDNETGDSDISDTAFLPPEARPRRVSHSTARPTQTKQKRMSLPPVRFAWAEEGRLE